MYYVEIKFYSLKYIFVFQIPAPTDTTSPVAKRTRNKKGTLSSSESGNEEDRHGDNNMLSRHEKGNVASPKARVEDDRHDNDGMGRIFNIENEGIL